MVRIRVIRIQGEGGGSSFDQGPPCCLTDRDLVTLFSPEKLQQPPAERVFSYYFFREFPLETKAYT